MESRGYVEYMEYVKYRDILNIGDIGYTLNIGGDNVSAAPISLYMVLGVLEVMTSQLKLFYTCSTIVVDMFLDWKRRGPLS